MDKGAPPTGSGRREPDPQAVPSLRASVPSACITQADRDAAADYLDNCGWDWGACGDVRSGRVEHPAVDALARYRLAANADLLTDLSAFLQALAEADLDEGAADAVTVGMVFQQEAERVWLPRIRAAQGTSGFAQDAQRLDPQGAGPVRQDAPEIKEFHP